MELAWWSEDVLVPCASCGPSVQRRCRWCSCCSWIAVCSSTKPPAGALSTAACLVRMQGYTGDACETKASDWCLVGCSGRGECVRGFCRCRPPYYGLGCLKGGQGQGQKHPPHAGGHEHGQQHIPARSRLKIYLYDLPWQVAFQEGYFPGEGGCAACSTLCCEAWLHGFASPLSGRPPQRSPARSHSPCCPAQNGLATTPSTSPSGSLPTGWPRTRRWGARLAGAQQPHVNCWMRMTLPPADAAG